MWVRRVRGCGRGATRGGLKGEQGQGPLGREGAGETAQTSQEGRERRAVTSAPRIGTCGHRCPGWGSPQFGVFRQVPSAPSACFLISKADRKSQNSESYCDRDRRGNCRGLDVICVQKTPWAQVPIDSHTCTRMHTYTDTCACVYACVLTQTHASTAAHVGRCTGVHGCTPMHAHAHTMLGGLRARCSHRCRPGLTDIRHDTDYKKITK